MKTNNINDYTAERITDKVISTKTPTFSSQIRSEEKLNVVFNTKTDLKWGTARIFFYNMCNEMKKLGVNAKFRDWENYEKYDFAIFKAIDFESENARKKNPNIKIGLVHPSDLNRKLIKEIMNADFLIVSTITERDYYLRYNKNIVIIHHSELEPGVFKNYENAEERDKTILVYHGNKQHLEAFDPELKNALEMLSKKYSIKLKAIYNIKNLGIWKKGRPDIKIEDIQHVQSEDMDSIHKEIIEGDIGLVPVMTSIPYKIKEKYLKKTKRYCFGAYDNDILVRYKNTSNAGRAFVFMQLGIPVVASPIPECCEVISPGETGFIALSEEGWIDSIERLITDFSVRKKIALNAKRLVLEKYTSRKAAEKLYEYLLQYNRNEAFFSKVLNPKESELIASAKRYYWSDLIEKMSFIFKDIRK